jgi:hypothetical protein
VQNCVSVRILSVPMHLLALHTNPVRLFISSVGSPEEMVPCPRVPRCLRVLSDLRSGLLRIERCLLLAAEWTVRCPCSCANEYGTSPAKGTANVTNATVTNTRVNESCGAQELARCAQENERQKKPRKLVVNAISLYPWLN